MDIEIPVQTLVALVVALVCIPAFAVVLMAGMIGR
jgi:hypothetical protein